MRWMLWKKPEASSHWAPNTQGDIIITVSDNGPGIAEANLARVFDPFYTTKPVGKGNGLGLSICYGIIKKIGGDINVSSTKGEGAAFEIRFPVNSTESPPDRLDNKKESPNCW
jgi:two-component system NtrC family sensor kinase